MASVFGFYFILILAGRRGQAIMPIVVFLTFLYFSGKLRLKLIIFWLPVLLLISILLWVPTWRGLNLSLILRALSFTFFRSPSEFARILLQADLTNFGIEDYYFGLSFVAAFLSFIPSSLWAFRDFSIGKLAVIFLGGNPDHSGGPQIGLVGEGFLNGGILGIIICGFLYGFLCKRLDNFNARTTNQKPLLKVYIMLVFWTLYSLFLSGSGVVQGFIAKTIVITPILILENRGISKRAIIAR
jgi:oligosaccharide repeat unit polymerase